MIWLPYLNALVALLATLGLAATAYGWRHSLARGSGEAERYFAAAKLAYAVAIGTRMIFWDSFWRLWMLHDPEAARRFSALHGHTDINIISSLLVLLGIYCSLKARLLLIPGAERVGWKWWSAWAHPQMRRRRRMSRPFDGTE